MSTIALAMGANSAVAELDKKKKKTAAHSISLVSLSLMIVIVFVNPVGKKTGKLERMAQIPLLNLNPNL